VSYIGVLLPSDTLDDKTPVEKTALKIARTYLHPNKANVC